MLWETSARRFMLSHAKRQRDERKKYALFTSVVCPGLQIKRSSLDERPSPLQFHAPNSAPRKQFDNSATLLHGGRDFAWQSRGER